MFPKVFPSLSLQFEGVPMGQAAPELTEAEVAQICRLATGVSGMVGEWSLQVCDGLMDRKFTPHWKFN